MEEEEIAKERRVDAVGIKNGEMKCINNKKGMIVEL